MEIQLSEYCDVCNDYVPLNTHQGDCAFEHGCELPKTECPLYGCFNQPKKTSHRNTDFLKYYFSELE